MLKFVLAALMCFASGDPHYRTFDAQIIHFQGTCRYLLSGTKPGSSEIPFQIFVENELRNGNKHVSWTKTVVIELFGLSISIFRNGLVQVVIIILLADTLCYKA